MDSKDLVGIGKDVVATLAILVGGIWTYNIFVKERQNFPHANLEHQISHIRLTKELNVLRIGVEIANTGSSRIVVGKANVWIQKIKPLSPCENGAACLAKELSEAPADPDKKADRPEWPLLAARQICTTRKDGAQDDCPLMTGREPGRGAFVDIEPGEKDVVDFEFVVPADVQIARVYTYFRNDKKAGCTNDGGRFYAILRWLAFMDMDNAGCGSEVGWRKSTYYNFQTSQGGSGK